MKDHVVMLIPKSNVKEVLEDLLDELAKNKIFIKIIEDKDFELLNFNVEEKT